LSPDEPVVAVVGAGITGLATAHRLLHPGPPGADDQSATSAASPAGGAPAVVEGPADEGARPRVVVVEADDRPGGKILTDTIDGRPLEAGPDAFVAGPGADARQHALALCHELGLSDQLISPATGRAFILVSGRLCPLPPGQVLGVPTTLGALRALRRAGLIGPRGLARGSLDLVLPPRVARGDDQTVAELIGHRFGTEVLSRVAGPLVGGIHAGSADGLSAAAVTPQLLAAARSGRSMMRGLQAARPRRTSADGAGSGGPHQAAPRESQSAAGQQSPRQGFFSLAGGLSVLVERLAETIREAGGELLTGAPALALSRHDGRWRLDLTGGRRVVADAVVLAVPAFSAASLLEHHDRSLSSLLGTIDYASVTLVTLTYPEAAVAHPLDGAGFLVSRAAPLLRPQTRAPLLTACTWTTKKWPYTKRPGEVMLRASTGRDGDDRALDMTDEELGAAVHAELAPLLGLSAPPTRTIVRRWPHSFPQYRVGHLSAVARLEEAAGRLPGVVLAGAAYRGLGIPACIAQGQEAAAKITAHLGVVVPG
jgi:oxygen-dependent protoporphyrinogen oxidase